MVVEIIITTVLLICSFLSKAVKDTLDHHYESSVFVKYERMFWDPKISWLAKYKDYAVSKEERFWGSTTIFVWLSDAWHLFDAIQALCWQICLSMWITIALGLEWYYGFGVFAAIKLCTVAFHYPYTYLFVKKK